MTFGQRTATSLQAETAFERLAMLREITREAEGLKGPDLIALALRHTHFQADLARASGLTGNTITALKKGKRPSAAQRSAILWGIARHLGLGL